MSTSTMPRPGTPFPTSHPSMPPFTHRRSAHPINFSIPPLPILTPPSLLKRSASTTASASASKHTRYASSSTSSSPRTPHTPILSAQKERRESTSSSCSSCSSSSSSRLSPILSTPLLHPEMIDNADVDVETLLDTPSEQHYPFAADYTVETSHSKFSTSISARPKLIRGAAVPLPPASGSLFVRPKLTRRDTPRPNSEMEAYSMRTVGGAVKRQGSYTSIMDGGKWVVV